jgi:hypothetical protein
MTNLLDCLAQETLCRIHALTDEQHRELWLSMAERWSYLAREETTGIGDAGRGVMASGGLVSKSRPD